MSTKMQPILPGAILRAEFLAPPKLTSYRVARDLRIPAQRISGIFA